MIMLIAVVLSGAVQDTTIMIDNIGAWWLHLPSCEHRLAAVDAVNLPNGGPDEWVHALEPADRQSTRRAVDGDLRARHPDVAANTRCWRMVGFSERRRSGRWPSVITARRSASGRA